MKKIKLLLFDADGTLWDFHKSEHTALSATFKKYGISQEKETFDLYAKINTKMWKLIEEGKTTHEVLRIDRFKEFLQSINHHEHSPEEVADYYTDKLCKEKDLIENAEELLKELKKEYIICLITNGNSYIQRKRLENNAIEKYLDEIYISHEHGASKPDPKMIFMAMEKYNVLNKQEVMIIGDSEGSDILAAKRAGIYSIYFNQEGKTSKNADYSVNKLMDILKILKKHQ